MHRRCKPALLKNHVNPELIEGYGLVFFIWGSPVRAVFRPTQHGISGPCPHRLILAWSRLESKYALGETCFYVGHHLHEKELASYTHQKTSSLLPEDEVAKADPPLWVGFNLQKCSIL